VLAAWALSSIPALSALVMWGLLGGHLSAPETLNLFLDNCSTAARRRRRFVCGSGIGRRGNCRDRYTRLHDRFMGAGFHGSRSTRATFMDCQPLADAGASRVEQGLLSIGLVAGICAAVLGFAALATVWLPPGVRIRNKLIRSIVCVLAVALALGLVTQIRLTFDVTEDRRNSFPAADQRLLASLAQPLVVTVHLAREDPRYADLQRNVLAKLERAVPNMSIRLAGERQSLPTNGVEDRYGEVEYSYGAHSDISRSTSPREILPMLYGPRRGQCPRACPGKRLSGLSTSCRQPGGSLVVFLRTSTLYRPRLVVESASTTTHCSSIIKEVQS